MALSFHPYLVALNQWGHRFARGWRASGSPVPDDSSSQPAADELLLVVLEPRVFFSGTPFDPSVEGQAVEPLLTPGGIADAPTAHDDPVISEPAPYWSDSQGSPHRVILADQQIEGVTELVESLRSSFDGESELILIPQGLETLDDLFELLADYRDIGELHIVSHGSAGTLQLGGLQVGMDALQSLTFESSNFPGLFAEDGSILLYGCSVASDPSGVAFVDALADWAGVTVWASVDATGSESRGGDWTLEFRSGPAETSMAALQLNPGIAWDGLLATITVNNLTDTVNGNTSDVASLMSSDGGDGVSLREAILAANATAGADQIVFNVGAGTRTIAITTALPAISDMLTIDGQGLIELDGSATIGALDGLHLMAGSDGSHLQGLVIYGFGGHGVFVESDSNVLTGNIIGTNASSAVGLGNGQWGIMVVGQDNTIGGMTASDRNVVSGNEAGGIRLTTSGAFGNLIVNNFIGVSVDGNSVLGNDGHGVLVHNNSFDNQIGAIGAGNLIGGNSKSGITIQGSNDNLVISNYIGVNASGASMGNGEHGILIQASSSSNQIGGVAAGEGNTIGFNAGAGVATSGGGLGNAVLGNKILHNGGLGIDLQNDGVTPNDPDDVDPGSNSLLNTPIINSVSEVAGGVEIHFQLDVPAGNYRIEFFDNASHADPSGYGEGASLLGTATVTSTGIAGPESFSVILPVGALPAFVRYSATATQDLGGGAFGSTSEFSPNYVKTQLIAGNETRVNPAAGDKELTWGFYRGSQNAVAISPTGDYVVVWSDEERDGDGWGVFAQRFNRDGQKVGGLIQVNVETEDHQVGASVAMDSAGRFAVVWASDDQDGDKWGTYLRRFEADGTAIDSSDLLINAGSTSGDQINVTVAMNDRGSMVLAWQDDANNRILARTFDMDSIPTGSQLSTPIIQVSYGSHRDLPSVDINNSGDFIVAWEKDKKPFVQRYDAAGNAVGGQIDVNPLNVLGGEEMRPVVALLESGEFFVAYKSEIVDGIYLARFHSDGTWDGLPRTVQLGSTLDSPSIAKDAAGNILVVFESGADGDKEGVFARKYSSSGASLGAVFQVNQTVKNEQMMASAAMLDPNNFVVVWSGEGNQPGQADKDGVFLRQYGERSYVTIPNQVPTIVPPANLSVNEDTPLTLAVADFGFQDADGDSLESIKLEAITGGILLVENRRLDVGEVISVAQIQAGKVQFLADAHLSGANAAALQYRVSDGLAYSTNVGVLGIDVKAIADQTESRVGGRWILDDPERVVNTNLIGSQDSQQVAALTQGGYVVVWTTPDLNLADGDDGKQMVAQRFDDQGNPVGTEWVIHPGAGAEQLDPRVVGLGDGGFLIAWTGGSPTTDVMAQRFDALGNYLEWDGSPGIGPNPTIVSENSSGHQFDIDAEATANGFLMTWASRDPFIGGDDSEVVARFFGLDGTASDEFVVNEYQTGIQRDPNLTALDGNRFLVTWVNQNGDSYDVQARLIDLGEVSPTSAEFTVNAGTALRQSASHASSLGQHGFVIVWHSEDGDGDGYSIKARRFDNNGTPIDPNDIDINVTTVGNQSSPKVVGHANGDYTVLWHSMHLDGEGFAVVSRTFDSGTETFSDETVVNRQAAGDQRNVDVAMLTNGRLVTVWDSSEVTPGNPTLGTEVKVGELLQSVDLVSGIARSLPIELTLIDHDGSESITQIILSQIPTGAVLSDGVQSFVSGATTFVDLTTWDLDNLTIQVPSGLAGKVALNLAVTSADGAGTTTSESRFFLKVTSPNNSAPVANDDLFSTDEATVLHGSVAGNDGDPDGHSLTYQLVQGPALGSLIFNSDGSFVFDPDGAFEDLGVGESTLLAIDYEVTDPFGATDTAIARITIHGVNDAPTRYSNQLFYTVAEDSVLTRNDLLANHSDVDGDPLTVVTTPLVGPAHGNLQLRSDGSFDYTPNANFVGTDVFRYRVIDGQGGSVAATVRINVQPVNDRPFFTSGDWFTVNENQTSVVKVTAQDREHDPLTYGLSGSGADDALFQIDPVTGMLEFLGAPDFENPGDHDSNNEYLVQVTVTDGLLTAHQDLRIQVVNVVEPAWLMTDHFTVQEGGWLNSAPGALLQNDQFFDGGSIQVTLGSGPQHGQVTVASDGSFIYRHDGSETTHDLFTYQVREASGVVSTETVHLTVQPVDDAPVANPDIVVFGPGDPLVIRRQTLLANDHDPDSALGAIQIVTQPPEGTITIGPGGHLILNMNQAFAQTSFRYVVISNGVTSQPADVLVLGGGAAPPQGPTPGSSTKGDSNPSGDGEGSGSNTPDPLVIGVDPNLLPPSIAGPTIANPGASLPISSEGFADTLNVERTSTADEPAENRIAFGGFGFDENRFSKSLDAVRPASDLILISLQNRTPANSDSDQDSLDWLSSYFFQLDSDQEDVLVPVEVNMPVTVTAAAGLLTVGYLTWMIRGGVLLTTFVSSLPAWQSFDPLVVVEHSNRSLDRGESIEEMVDRQDDD